MRQNNEAADHGISWAGSYVGALKDLTHKISSLMAMFFDYKDYDSAVYDFSDYEGKTSATPSEQKGNFM